MTSPHPATADEDPTPSRAFVPAENENPPEHDGFEPDVAREEPIQVTLQPMLHVEKMAGAVAVFEVLGGRVTQGSGDGDWAKMTVGGAEVGLLAHGPNPEQGEGAVELTFQSSTPLERVEQAARDAGVEVRTPIATFGFGRQLVLATPDGTLVKINEIRAHVP